MRKKAHQKPRSQQASKSGSVNNATTDTSNSTVRCAPQTQRTERSRTYFTERSIKKYVKHAIACRRETLKIYRGAVSEDWSPDVVALQFTQLGNGYRFACYGGWIDIDENAYRYVTDSASRAGVMCITYTEVYMEALFGPF